MGRKKIQLPNIKTKLQLSKGWTRSDVNKFSVGLEKLIIKINIIKFSIITDGRISQADLALYPEDTILTIPSNSFINIGKVLYYTSVKLGIQLKYWSYKP